MISLPVFWLFLLGALTIGWQAGDRRDRQVIVWIGTAAALSSASHMLVPGWAVPIAVGIVDLALLAILIRYALVSRHHWPMWFAGFQAAALLIGITALLFPLDSRLLVGMISGFWAIPALLVMVIGLLADQRRGIVNVPS